MTIEQFIAFNIVLIISIISPGPAFLVALRTTLSAGRAAGISIGAGLGLMASTWTLMALLGMDVIFRLFPWAYGIAKAAGAIYLLYIAYNMWVGARDKVDTDVRPSTHAFRQGILINLLNPKSVLFAATVLIVVFPAEMSGIENAIIVFNHLILELIFYTVLAIGMSSSAVSKRYMQAKVYFDRTASIILGALGVRLLTNR